MTGKRNSITSLHHELKCAPLSRWLIGFAKYTELTAWGLDKTIIRNQAHTVLKAINLESTDIAWGGSGSFNASKFGTGKHIATFSGFWLSNAPISLRCGLKGYGPLTYQNLIKIK